MSDLSIFNNGSKVVISPDKMRAWISLVPPARGVKYTVENVTQWLPANGVVFGADANMIQQAVSSQVYDDLLEVARGEAPVAPVDEDYRLHVEKKSFTGLRGSSDGALIYDDLSFLQEAPEGQILAEIVPATPAKNGRTVTGEEIEPRGSTPGRELTGSGFVLSEDGRYYLAPSLSHYSFVNDQLVVTPLRKLNGLSEEDGEIIFSGNLLISGDVLRNSKINVTGSVYVDGRAVSCHIQAGNNVLLSGGMRSEGGGFATIKAKGHVWGLFFESSEIEAGGDLNANHLTGCEVNIKGRANILGGRALIAGSHVYAQNGVVCGTIGMVNDGTEIAAGMTRELIDTYTSITQRTDRLNMDIQSLRQNITAHERVNRMKADKGQNDPKYKEMTARLKQSLSVLAIIDKERTRQKKLMASFSGVSIIAREVANVGATISIDTRTLKVLQPLHRTKFRRDNEMIEMISAQNK